MSARGIMACIVLWGLTPLTWFRPGHLITTSDLFLPITPADWASQLLIWNPRFGTGAEWMTGPSALVSTGLTAAVMALGGTERLAQQVDFVAWFLLPGMTLWWFLRQVTPGPRWKILHLVAVNVYMFNLFLEAMWAGNKAGLSAYAVLPLLLGITYRALQTRRWLTHAVAFALASILGSGASTNPQVSLVMFLAWAVFLVSYGVAKIRSRADLVNAGWFCGAAAVLTIGCHAFWLWPQLALAQDPVTWQSLKNFARETASWLSGLSASTSLYNVARMQGAWTWYQGWYEPYATYSAMFRENPCWIALSWAWLGLVGLGVMMSRRWLDGCFVLLAVLGVAFGTGIHSPLGPLYQWMVLHVPLFGLVRSPWYKFTLLTCLGYAYLIGLATQRLADGLRTRAGVAATVAGRWRIRPSALVLGVLGINMVYAFPVTTGRMYPTAAERAKLKPCHVQVPPYVDEAGRWFDMQPGFFRIFHTPKHTNGISVYRWGFVGIPPALYHTSTRPLLFNTGPLAFQESGNHLVTAAHQALQEGRTHRMGSILRMLGARYILQEDDVDYDYFESDGDTPHFMAEALAEQRDVVADRSFGPWRVWAVAGDPPEHATVAQRVVWIDGGAEALAPLANAGWLTPHTALAFRDEPSTPRGASDIPAGLIRGACLINPRAVGTQPIPAEAARLLLVQDTTTLEASVEPNTVWPPQILQIQWKLSGFYEPTRVPDDAPWVWLAQDPTSQVQAHLVVENLTQQPLVSHCQIVVQSYGMDRHLYVYVNDELVAHPPVPQGAPRTLLLKDLHLRPGQNRVRLYSPSAWSVRGDNQQVSFAFDPGQFRFGRLVYRGSLTIPRHETYRVSLWRFGVGRTAQGTKSLQLGGHRLALLPGQAAARAWGPTVLRLPSGVYPIEVAQDHVDDHFAILLEAGPSWPVTPVSPITIQPASPIVYQGEVHLDAPGLLVFNESYSPRWQLTEGSTGRPLATAHWRINGFANGYWIPAAGTYRVRLEHVGQRVVQRGWMVTAGTLGLCVVLFAIGRWLRRTR